MENQQQNGQNPQQYYWQAPISRKKVSIFVLIVVISFLIGYNFIMLFNKKVLE